MPLGNVAVCEEDGLGNLAACVRRAVPLPAYEERTEVSADGSSAAKPRFVTRKLVEKFSPMMFCWEEYFSVSSAEDYVKRIFLDPVQVEN